MVDDPPVTGQVLFKKYYKTAEEKKASRRASTATAVGGFEAWSPERIGEFVFRAGKPYEPFKNVFVEKGVTGALIAQYLLDGDLKDALTELGIKEDLRQVALEGQFKKAQKEATADGGGGGGAPPPALGRQASVLQKASSMQAIEWKDLDVVKYLGKGSYGKVYSGKLGVDVGRRLARPVALKVFTSAMSNDDRRCDDGYDESPGPSPTALPHRPAHGPTTTAASTRSSTTPTRCVHRLYMASIQAPIYPYLASICAPICTPTRCVSSLPPLHTPRSMPSRIHGR